MEELLNKIEEQSEEIKKLKEELKELKDLVNKITKNNDKSEAKSEAKSEDNIISIILKKYKRSLLIKNMYKDKNTTIKCKELFKKCEAKWLKTEQEMGWLLVGKYEDNKSLEENSEYIIEKLKDNRYELEISYEK